MPLADLKRDIIVLRISSEQKRQLKRAASARGQSMSDLFRQSVQSVIGETA
ncbi:MAG: DUF1778 domain-containing protein [Rhizobiaceae bacterium]|nr:DUF1778 domain-containing protein [Rhizobiaceae bacterium]MCV0405886.1 DUF1778 domain-containing protein [Rhizobiaceae bacterium]